MSLNRAALLADILANLPDNTSGAITPAALRGVLDDVVSNVWTLQDSQTTSGTITFSAIALGLTGLLYGHGASAVTALAAGQIPGTATNDSASAGNIGEFLTQTSASVSLTTATPITVISIPLTAGDWDVFGDVQFVPAATTGVTYYGVASNTATNTFPASAVGGGMQQLFATFAAGYPANLAVGCERYSFAGTTTVYLVAQADFTTSTMLASAKISARRAR